jgi:hypothetical protein
MRLNSFCYPMHRNKYNYYVHFWYFFYCNDDFAVDGVLVVMVMAKKNRPKLT